MEDFLYANKLKPGSPVDFGEKLKCVYSTNLRSRIEEDFSPE